MPPSTSRWETRFCAGAWKSWGWRLCRRSSVRRNISPSSCPRISSVGQSRFGRREFQQIEGAGRVGKGAWHGACDMRNLARLCPRGPTRPIVPTAWAKGGPGGVYQSKCCGRLCPPYDSDSFFPQKRKLGIVVASSLCLHKAVRRRKPRVCSLHDNHQRLGRQPAAVAQRRQRFLREPLAVGRIEKHEPEWLIRMHRTESRRIAAENARDAAKAQRLHVLSDQRARFGPIIDEESKGRATRHRLQAERAGAGEKVEHAGAGDRVVI